MKSPITGKEMILMHESRSISFRKEEFDIQYRFYKCEDTGEQFTTTALDEWNMNLVHNQYRVKHNIPTVEEIKQIRSKYQLSLSKMSDILGFGPNTYRLYEQGDVPSLPNANLIKMASIPASFRSMVEGWVTEDNKGKQKILSKTDGIIGLASKNIFSSLFKNYLMGSHVADELTGYVKPNLEKMTEMVVYFSHHVSCYKTKMNKLLFYADFLNFRETGYAISGARYKAISYGPVPDSFQSIFDKLAKEDVIDVYYEEKSNDTVVERLVGREDRLFKAELFSDTELLHLSMVKDQCEALTTKDIVDLSHEEPGWIDNEKSKTPISYMYALDLKGV